jgi:methanogenic corrinoid protein MtbC1
MTAEISSGRLGDFADALLALDRVWASRLLREEGDARSPFAAVETLIVPAFDAIGNGWERGDIALSQVYMSARICEELVSAVPELSLPFRPDRPRIAVAALEDYHLLGKRLVLSMLRASGFAPADYGVLDAPALAARAHADNIDALLVSVLMLRSALHVRDLKTQLVALGSKTRVYVGGAPFRFDPNLWREVGADGWGRTASDAVNLVAQLMEATR